MSKQYQIISLNRISPIMYDVILLTSNLEIMTDYPSVLTNNRIPQTAAGITPISHSYTKRTFIRFGDERPFYTASLVSLFDLPLLLYM